MRTEITSEKEQQIVDGILAKKKKNYFELELIANRIRKHIVDMVSAANSGHPGGPLGLADIYSVLYFRHMKYDSANPTWEGRDRILLSNGHVCAVRYSTMALAGYFKTDELLTFRQLGSRLQGHPSTRYLPEMENSSGSLGQGLSNASGLALGLKAQKKKNRVFVCMSDGECQEGMTWEAAMAVSHYGLTNITPFIDYNNIQIDGFVDKVMSLGDLKAKFQSFGWDVKVVNGHSIKAIDEAFTWATEKRNKPRIILFKTILGKGVSFMKNNPKWHGVPPNEEQRNAAIAELNAESSKILKKLAVKKKSPTSPKKSAASKAKKKKSNRGKK